MPEVLVRRQKERQAARRRALPRARRPAAEAGDGSSDSGEMCCRAVPGACVGCASFAETAKQLGSVRVVPALRCLPFLLT